MHSKLAGSIKLASLAVAASLVFLPVSAVGAVEKAGTNIVVVTPALLGVLSEKARTNHAGLQGDDARLRAARLHEESIRSWDDPMISVGGTVFSARGGDPKHEGDIALGIEQTLPLGRPSRLRAVARAETRVVEAERENRFQLIRKEIAVSAFQLALQDELQRLLAEDLSWMGLTLEVAEQRHQAGDISQVDLLKLRNARSSLEQQRRMLAATRAERESHLNRLLRNPRSEVWPSMALPPLASPVAFTPRLVDMALKFEPRIKTQVQRVKHAEAELQVTRKNLLPEVRVGVEKRFYSGDRRLRETMGFVSFSLPWLQRGESLRARERDTARVQAAGLELTDMEHETADEIFMLIQKIEVARTEHLLYRDEIGPRTRQSLEALSAAWESNRGMLSDLLEARRMLLDSRRMELKALADQYLLLSELVLCCGLGDLEELQALGTIPETESPQPTNPSP